MNMNMVKETIETSAWTDREILLRTYYQVVETNGTVRLHDREIYGDPTHGLVGLKVQATANTESRVRLSGQWRIVCALGTLIVTAVFALLGIILANGMGG